MKKTIIFLTIMALALNIVEAQQIKRSTLTSVGKLKTVEPFRVSWTAGSCPGCTVLHSNDTSAPNIGYLRQGFQQPTFNGNMPGCPSLTPVFNIAPITSPSCGTTFDFEYAGITVPNMTVEWNFGEGAVPQTSTELNPMGVFYTTIGIKIISLRVMSNSTCSESRAKTLNIAPTQIVFSTKASVVDVKCRNDRTGAINITPLAGFGPKTYRWSTGETTQNLVNVAGGRYTVTATDANGCSTVLDTVIKQPAASLSYTVIIKQETCKGYEDGSIDLTVTGGTAPYKVTWATGATTTSISSLIAGQYRTTIVDTNGCRVDTSFFIARRCRDTLRNIFDLITPNGDMNNDKWIIANIEKYPDNELFIYNRWGQLVYSTKKYLNDWAGTNDKGEELPTGAYYYVVQLNDGSTKPWEGSVTILR